MTEENKADAEVRVLLLDLGNVVFELDTGPIIKWFVAHIDPHGEGLRSRFQEMEALFDRGDLQPEEFVERLRSEFGLRASDAEFFQVWVRCWRRDTPGMDALLSALPAAIRPCVLSNTNRTHFEHFLANKPILQRFDKRYLSYQIGLRKPEPEIFRHVIDDLNIPASAILYFDDIEENVKAAGREGIDAHIFQSIEQIRALLNMPEESRQPEREA